MEKQYQILMHDNNVIIILLSKEINASFWINLQKDITEKKLNDTIMYFDLLYINGTTNRFFKTKIINGIIPLHCTEKTELPKQMMNVVKNFYRENIDIINESVLSSIQKKFFKLLLNRNEECKLVKI